ncbi:hypothetical protein [Salirhabdus sp. Marseille-P4669]|uniref:hypothetical protein n=1 Tax=Salirhabdus sp. Marseille-P4669 TaxID=2042310 RepID=UPI000C7E293B|nr:hypothetical protein [Salirhabdus sp. Marseille-P4669]
MDKKEAIFWSIALPGFGQLLNGRYIKGILFIFLEFLVNVQSHFNLAIMASFQGEIARAFQVIDYQWLMFYPCLYFFAMYDAFRDADIIKDRYIFLPFVFCAYFVTVGLMISPKVTFFGLSLGPVFLPMSFVIPGLIVGFTIRRIFLATQRET